MKRLRVFAGPNGSGKSTIINIVSNEGIHLGIYCNADDYKRDINRNHIFDFNLLGIILNEEHFINAIKESNLYNKMEGNILLNNITFNKNVLYFASDYEVNDYFTSFLVSFNLCNLLDHCDKFSYETVMSHHSKIDFLKSAKHKGYKIYLYFVSLIDPQLNIGRVATRVNLGGHNVPSDKVESRYYRSMDNLFDAINIADKSYIFDNSHKQPKLIATVLNDKLEIQSSTVPLWFNKYVLEKIINS